MAQMTIKCLNCGKVTKLPKDAQHKKFCSARCRVAWHNERRRQAMAALAEQEAEGVAQQIEEGVK